LDPEQQKVNIFIPEPRGFAVWRMPGENKFFFTGGNWSPFQGLDTNRFEGPGFVFHPFNSDLGDTFLLTNHMGIGALTREETEQFSSMGLDSGLVPKFPKQFDWMSNEKRKDAFVKLVEKAIKKISSGSPGDEKGKFRKIVASRVEVHNFASNPWKVFLTLSDKHPNAFVSYVNIEGLGQWIGASPELLCRVEKGGKFKTVALAGTSDSGSFGNKEKKEQEMVSDFIEKKIHDFGITSFTKSPIEKIDTGGVSHLQTRFELDLPDDKDPGELLRKLHPTPAVAGLPQKKSMEFISEYENHPRAYYTGFLGPVLSDRIFSIYVNLRCMQVFMDKVVLYTGAGITADSDPEAELQETQMKIQSLKDALE
jgi:isochorismate synthase